MPDDSSSELEKRMARLEKRADDMDLRVDGLVYELRKLSSAIEPLKKGAFRTYNRILRVFDAVRKALSTEDDPP